MLGSEPVKCDIPHEAGEWMELRALSFKQLKAARKKQEKEQREIIKDFGAEFFAAIQRGGDAAVKAIERQQYHVSNFDMEELLVLGVSAWSYNAEVNLDNIGALDEKTAVWAAKTIIDMTKPPDEDEEKNS